MARLFAILFHTLRRNLVAFAAIVAVLAAGNWLRDEWRAMQACAAELPLLEAADGRVRDGQAALARAAAQRAAQLSGATLEQLDAAIRTVDDDIRRLEREADDSPTLPAMLGRPDALPNHMAHAILRKTAVDLRRQERTYLVALRTRLHTALDRDAAVARLEALRLAHARTYASLQQTLRQRAALDASAGWLARVPFTHAYRELQALRRQADALHAANERAYQAYRAQRTLVDGLPSVPVPAAFLIDERRLADIAAPLRDRLAQAETLAAQNGVRRLYDTVRPVLALALGVLVGWWFVPAAIRCVFYFVLAPLAARRPPVVLQAASQGASAPAPDRGRISGLARTLTLHPGQELVIRPDYCQSQPLSVRADTTLLFDRRRWPTSIAAHLWLLKRLRAAQPADVVVSSAGDPLDEVAILQIATGEAFVLQPRALVGALYETGRRPRIRSHWRLGTLHAWLTLQLRYLAFEGPATLIVKGCRGVRLERADAGRTIGQDATLGFSALARYATVRAEPFLPYLMGRQPLLHDSFTGPDAWYLYEEVPRGARPGRARGNPLEALVDAGLKAFGI